MNKREVVITGAAIASPLGYSVRENISAIWEGRSNFTEITRYNPKGSSIRFAGECENPNVKKLPDRKVQKILRRKDVISLLTTINLFEEAGVKSGENVDPERIGMYVGAGSTQIGDLTPYFELVADCADLDKGDFDSKRFGRELLGLVNPLVVLQNLMNNGLCFGSMTLDIRGVNANFMDFQVAGLRAVGEGFRSIQTDRADMVLCGGISAPIEPFYMGEGVHAGYLAKTSESGIEPSKVVKPYDRDRFGTILSEGAVYVLLEEKDHAKARGAKILGEVCGFGFASDARFELMQERDSAGLYRATQLAMSEAGLLELEPGLIVGHGNGSKAPDLAESRAYYDVFGEKASDIPLWSAKSVLGEMSEAAGVASVIFALEALFRKGVPPTYNYSEGDEVSKKLLISNKPQEIESDLALVTSRSLVGFCCVLALTSAT